MIRRGGAMVVLAGLMLAVFAFGLAWAEKYETKSGEVQDSMELKFPDVFTHPKRGPVTFSHQAHHQDYGVKCQQCHHMYEDGKNEWKPGDEVNTCADCHTEPYKNIGGMPSLHQAFHRNCLNCHKATDDAPKACDECHG